MAIFTKENKKVLISVNCQDGLAKGDTEVEDMTFSYLQIGENQVEEFLRKNIDVVFDETETLLIVGQQVINAAKGRSDLVALDDTGSIVLIEIKRDVSDIKNRKEPFEFQAIRYAASLARIHDLDDLVERIFVRYIEKHQEEFPRGDLTNAELGKRIVTDFLRKNNALQTFNQQQRIILLASDFDLQTLSAVAWLISNKVDITAFRMTPRRVDHYHFLDVTRILPPDYLEDFFVDIAGTERNSAVKKDSKGGKRANLPRMKTLMEWGLIKPGDTVVIVNQDNSEATVIDYKFVRYNGEDISFNAWGSKVTGWSSICIYDWARTSDSDKTLGELRRAKMEEIEQKALDESELD